MKNIIKIIQESILDVCIEPIAESGIFDPQNETHIISLIEKLEVKNISEKIIKEAIDAIREAGKHPERQAYNKEGWLVTFPSPEYKQAAIKRGTHYGSDPTHGKGGMNVYYKKKGKQARKDTQQLSTSEPIEPTTAQAAPTAKSASSQLPKQSEPKTDATALPKGDTSDKDGESGENVDIIDFSSQYEKDPDALPKTDDADNSGDASSVGSGDKKSSTSVATAPAAPVAPPTPDFVNISVEFAKSKSWSPTPYGEWRNPSGEQTAVVALSGEVVPVKSTDREELKLLSTKSIN